MGEKSETSDSTPVMFFQQETPSAIGVKLNDTNYRLWSKVLEMHIAAREKYGYISGTKSAPKDSDPTYEKWMAENALVKSWLINSMVPALMMNFIHCETAKDVWDTVKKTYHDASDASQVYELMKKSFQMRQDGRPVTIYFTELNSTFMELDFRRPNDMANPLDFAKLKKRISEERVYTFLAGLDHHLDQVCGRILATTPLPDIDEAFSIVRREAQRQVTMAVEATSEASALAVKRAHLWPTTSSTTSQTSSTSLEKRCSHCDRKGHEKESCWKIIGYPEWYMLKKAEREGKKPSQANSASTNTPQPSQVYYSKGSSHDDDDWCW